MMTNALFAYDMSTEAIQEILKPLTASLEAHNSTVEFTPSVTPLGKWIDFYHMFNLTEGAGGGDNKVSASRLLPAKSLMDEDAVAEMLFNAGPGTEKTDVSVNVDIQ
jgi:hypothetical protein